MPRRSFRNHVSTRAADIEIAARLTAIHLCDLEDGPEAVRADCRRRAQSPDRQPNINCVKLRLPPIGITGSHNISRITDWILCADGGLHSYLPLQDGEQKAHKKGSLNRRRGKKGRAEYLASLATPQEHSLPMEPNWLNHPGPRYPRASTPPNPSGYGQKNRGG